MILLLQPKATYGIGLSKFVYTNLPQAGFELGSLGQQASVLPIDNPLFLVAVSNLSTPCLIQPSYTIRATIFEKVFRYEKFPKTRKYSYKKNLMLCLSLCLVLYCSYSLSPTSGGQAGNKKTRQRDKQSIKFKLGKLKCSKEIKITAPSNEWRNIPLRTAPQLYQG